MAQQQPPQPQNSTRLSDIIANFLGQGRARWIVLGGAGAFLMFVGGVCFVSGSGDSSLAVPTPTPVQLPTPTPMTVIQIVTATPLPPTPPLELGRVVPYDQMEYGEYRFYHAWTELEHCRRGQLDFLSSLAPTSVPPTPVYAEGEPTFTPEPPSPTPEPTPTHAERERAMIEDMQTSIQWLMDQYATGKCRESPVYTSYPGRLNFLRWALAYEDAPGS